MSTANLNQVTLVGRVGKKPEITTMQDGKKIAKFSIATSEYWKDKETNEKKENTLWHRIVVYNSKLAEIIESYTQEGALVFVEGKIKYDKWVDQSGQEKKATSIVIDLNGKFMMLDSKKNSNQNSENSTYLNKMEKEDDDDLPF